MAPRQKPKFLPRFRKRKIHEMLGGHEVWRAPQDGESVSAHRGEIVRQDEGEIGAPGCGRVRPCPEPE